MRLASDARSHSHHVSATTARISAALTLAIIVSSCSSGDASLTGPEFSKGGIPSVMVTSLADDGSAGTLRSVIAAAPAGANVTFASNLCALGSHCTIALQPIPFHSSSLVIDKSLQIVGPTGYTLAVDAGGAFAPVLEVDGPNSGQPPMPVTIKNLTITGGGGSSTIGVGLAGAIVEFNVNLNLVNMAITGNYGGYGAFGGQLGSVTLTNSSVTGNTGLSVGAFFLFNIAVTLRNSTVTGNTATSGTPNAGGGAVIEFGTLTLETGACINNNTTDGTTSSDPWNAINVLIMDHASVTGRNCGVAHP